MKGEPIPCVPQNEKARGLAGSWPRQEGKEGIMVLTTDCYIISPKSQKGLADNRESLLAGVAAATPAFLFKGGKHQRPSVGRPRASVGVPRGD